MNASQMPNTDIEPKAGSWILLVGPRSMNATLLTVIARLGERGTMRVLDGGNRFNAYGVARVVRGRPEVLNRIMVSRAVRQMQTGGRRSILGNACSFSLYWENPAFMHVMYRIDRMRPAWRSRAIAFCSSVRFKRCWLPYNKVSMEAKIMNVCTWSP